MADLMDDPTTYLSRDNNTLAMILADSLSRAQDVCRMYGVSIQVQPVAGAAATGIRVVTSYAEAVVATANYPSNTPWCVAAGKTDFTAYNALVIKFGQPQTMAKALGLETEGIAWRPDKFPVQL